MPEDYLDIALNLGSAWVAGSLIGLERSFRGRPAGFRTHALVCTASALLMVLAVYQFEWFSELLQAVRADPTRMAQGIMTGIGFLGAGVIFKEGVSVRGLTTAASIWVTAALGILYGVGFYYPAMLGTVITFGTLSIFRWIESRMPAEYYANYLVRFPREQVWSESVLRELLKQHGCSIASMNYELARDEIFEYRTVIRTLDKRNFARLAKDLRRRQDVEEFRITVRSK